MAKEVITGAEALMRSLKNEDVKTILDIRAAASCQCLMHCTVTREVKRRCLTTSWYVTSRLLLTLHRVMPESAAKWASLLSLVVLELLIH